MENMDSYTTHLGISALLTSLVYFIVLIACIILFIKKKSAGTIILLVGSFISIFGLIATYAFNALAASKDAEAIMESTVIMSYFNNFTFFVFGLGLLLFAVNDLKK